VEDKEKFGDLIFEGEFGYLGRGLHLLVYKNKEQKYSVLEKKEEEISIVGGDYEFSEMFGVIIDIFEKYSIWKIVFSEKATGFEREKLDMFVESKVNEHNLELCGYDLPYNPPVPMRIQRYKEGGEIRYIVFVKVNNEWVRVKGRLVLNELGNILRVLLSLDIFNIEISNYLGCWEIEEIKKLAKIIGAKIGYGLDERKNTSGIVRFVFEKWGGDVFISPKYKRR